MHFRHSPLKSEHFLKYFFLKCLDWNINRLPEKKNWYQHFRKKLLAFPKINKFGEKIICFDFDEEKKSVTFQLILRKKIYPMKNLTFFVLLRIFFFFSFECSETNPTKFSSISKHKKNIVDNLLPFIILGRLAPRPRILRNWNPSQLIVGYYHG